MSHLSWHKRQKQAPVAGSPDCNDLGLQNALGPDTFCKSLASKCTPRHL